MSAWLVATRRARSRRCRITPRYGLPLLGETFVTCYRLSSSSGAIGRHDILTSTFVYHLGQGHRDLARVGRTKVFKLKSIGGEMSSSS